MIEIYTDGACSGNPGQGGWAAIILENGSERIIHGQEKSTTNNRMEMKAAIEGLASLPTGVCVTLISDSQYVVNTMTRKWKRKSNTDLWSRLDEETDKRAVEWRWVRGHAGNPLNEKADSLAQREAKGNHALPENTSLTHVEEGGRARMVDIGPKLETQRTAVAKGSVTMLPETLQLIRSNSIQKGDVLGTARIAGVMGAKNTSGLIPLCHPLPLDYVDVEFDFGKKQDSITITSTAKTTAKTGVEMEALTAVTVAALTIYDMAKSSDRGMRISNIRLVRKSGGKSGNIVLEN